MLFTQKPVLACALAGAVLIAGCGSSGSSSTSASSPNPASTSAPSSAAGGAGSSTTGPGALSADARSAATGDIPDTQVFLVYTNKAGGYSMKYPEGWTQLPSGNDVTFRDKNNLVRIQMTHGPAPTPASVTAQLNALKGSNPLLNFTTPHAVTISGSPAVKSFYTTESAPNPVTGKRVQLIVDRYELSHAGRVATVDLGTAKGVDNVDAYRMMIASFRWQ